MGFFFLVLLKKITVLLILQIKVVFGPHKMSVDCLLLQIALALKLLKLVPLIVWLIRFLNLLNLGLSPLKLDLVMRVLMKHLFVNWIVG